MKRQPHNSSWRSKHRHWMRGKRQWFQMRHGMKPRQYDSRERRAIARECMHQWRDFDLTLDD